MSKELKTTPKELIYLVSSREDGADSFIIATPSHRLATQSFRKQKEKIIANNFETPIIYNDLNLFEIEYQDVEHRTFVELDVAEVIREDESIWYEETWNEDDLKTALEYHDLPPTEMTIEYMKALCLNIFQDMNKRNELLQDKASELKSLISILEAHGLNLNDIEPEEVEYFMETNQHFDDEQQCRLYYKVTFESLLRDGDIVKTSLGYVSKNIV